MAENRIVIILDLAQVFVFRVEFIIDLQCCRIGAGTDMDSPAEFGFAKLLDQLRQQIRPAVLHAVLSGDDCQHRSRRGSGDGEICDLNPPVACVGEGVAMCADAIHVDCFQKRLLLLLLL
ncbi:hypothetical protein SDC9_168667 [bioreactor metagenome]|uniref:Uncharacterized protein n=1 Tax=bioreactor metagenome TaxID=1076179 RepID=A0A645G350_9ZZZZ